MRRIPYLSKKEHSLPIVHPRKFSPFTRNILKELKLSSDEMPLKNYGVWVAYPKTFVAEKDDDKPHLQLTFDHDPSSTGKGRYRAAINIKSSTISESRLVYWFVRNFQNSIVTEEIVNLDPGFHQLNAEGPPSLDYIRGNLFRPEDGSLLAHNVQGENNDIIDFVSPVLTQAVNRKAQIFLFGEAFPDNGDGKPFTGIHDVHMNQGNSGSFKQFNGIWQDGGILLHFPDDGHWEGIFLAFGVQSAHTSDRSGDPIGGVSFANLLENRPPPIPITTPTDPDPNTNPDTTEPTRPDPTSTPQPSTTLFSSITIRAAIVNPFGPDQAPTRGATPETVYLTNKSPVGLSLTGCTLVNRSGQRQSLQGIIPAHSSRGYEVPNAPLSNKGGTITLLDRGGLKVDGVSYSRAEAAREGDLVWFG